MGKLLIPRRTILKAAALAAPAIILSRPAWAATNVWIPTTIPPASLVTGQETYSFRQVITNVGAGSGPVASLGQVRVTFYTAPGGGTSYSTDHVSIGVSSGTDASTAATPVELTFNTGQPGAGSGGHGFTITVSTNTIVSDWVTLAFSSAQNPVVISDVSAANGNMYYAADANVNIWYKGPSTASYNVATATSGGGWASAGAVNRTITLIETQAPTGGGSSSVMMSGVGQ